MISLNARHRLTATLSTWLFLSHYADAASGKDYQDVALELGSVLASEKACGLTYNQVAIEKFIQKNVDDENMHFTATLKLMTDGVSFSLAAMSMSEKTAHCAQIKRVAKRNGFID